MGGVDDEVVSVIEVQVIKCGLFQIQLGDLVGGTNLGKIYYFYLYLSLEKVFPILKLT